MRQILFIGEDGYLADEEVMGLIRLIPGRGWIVSRSREWCRCKAVDKTPSVATEFPIDHR